MNRLEMLNNKIARDEELKMEQQRLYEKEQHELLARVVEYQPRIYELLELANALRMKQKIANKWDCGKSGWFADGWNHHIGFMGHGAFIDYIGYYAGGACGPWDFYTNGFVTFEKHEDNDKTRPASNSKIKSFLKDFDKFETDFYAWFDKEFGEEN